MWKNLYRLKGTIQLLKRMKTRELILTSKKHLGKLPTNQLINQSSNRSKLQIGQKIILQFLKMLIKLGTTLNELSLVNTNPGVNGNGLIYENQWLNFFFFSTMGITKQVHRVLPSFYLRFSKYYIFGVQTISLISLQLKIF